MIEAVIFDMDGVVMDSERVGNAVLLEGAKEQGINMTLPFVRSVMGMTLEASVPLYRAAYPALDRARLAAYFTERMARIVREGGIPLMKGVPELMDTLDENHIPRALASSTIGGIVRNYLESVGMYDRFTAIVSGEMCEKSKPDPDIFLRAARALDVLPERCLVLEDSVNGVKAGRAAGMTVGMVPDQVPYTDALKPYCDYVFPDMFAVREMMNRA